MRFIGLASENLCSALPVDFCSHEQKKIYCRYMTRLLVLFLLLMSCTVVWKLHWLAFKPLWRLGAGAWRLGAVWKFRLSNYCRIFGLLMLKPAFIEMGVGSVKIRVLPPFPCLKIRTLRVSGRARAWNKSLKTDWTEMSPENIGRCRSDVIV